MTAPRLRLVKGGLLFGDAPDQRPDLFDSFASDPDPAPSDDRPSPLIAYVIFALGGFVAGILALAVPAIILAAHLHG